MAALNVAGLRQAVAESRYLIKLHAKQRMGERKVSDTDVQRVIALGDVIEQTPGAQPFPKALFMLHTVAEPLYVVCAFDGQWAHVITVYWYDASKWIDPWTRRKP